MSFTDKFFNFSNVISFIYYRVKFSLNEISRYFHKKINKKIVLLSENG